MRPLLVALVLLIAAPVRAQSPTDLHALVREWWTWRLDEEPLFASYVGERSYDDRLPDVSAEARAARVAALEAFRAWFDSLGLGTEAGAPVGWSAEDAITAQILGVLLDDALAAHRFGAHRTPIQATGGFHSDLTRLPDQMPFQSAGDYENYLARLRAIPAYVDQQIVNLREGIADGYVLPRVALQGIPATIRAHVVDDPTESVFWAPFARFPQTMPEADRVRLGAAGREAIREAVVPGYAAFLGFIEDEYLPAASETVGMSDLPGGREAYAWRVRHFTTLDTTPEEVHALGLREVERIRGEMDAVLAEVGWTGTFAEFLDFLRTDPQFTAESPEALLQEGAWIAMQMNAQLPRLFGRLPRLPYTVQPVPDHLAPTFTAGFYVEPPASGLVPGVYWINTYDLPSRPTWALEALTFHEAVPGHHLQIALAQELDHLPPFRRALVLTAYEEGWGLYAESLGHEAGFYTDPYRRFGQLTYEMWRACRLVVDTGAHAFGWSRQQVVDYLAANTALSDLEIQSETDRYLAWPGQALGYKVGELTIRRLRTEAEAVLGEQFDVRGFHDEVLGHGELPMDVLEAVVQEWIAGQEG